MQALVDRLQRALSPQFTILREIAGGGMGRVFLAQDQALDRPVAIKVLRPELATALGAERFLREARLLARLRHPNILPVFQGGEADGLLYHVLEYQDGETLAQRLTRGPLGKDEWSRLAQGLLAALEAAHAAGVVHRDIKPSNIFLVQDRVVVGDFGIAHTDTTGDPLTESGSLLGTRAYMAPEQLRGAATTPQTDLYSAALVLVEAASGHRLDAPAPGGARVWSGVRKSLVRPLRRALAGEPEARWANAAAMRAALFPSARRRWLLPVAGVAVALAVWQGWPPPAPPSGSTMFVLGVARLDGIGAAPGARWADSVRGALVGRMRSFPDFTVDTAPGAPVALRISGVVQARGDSLQVDLEAQSAAGRRRALRAAAVGLADWRPLVDSLALEIMEAIWLGDDGQASSLPHGALPGLLRSRERWLRAEFAYRDGNWTKAREGYEESLALDPTCFLCAYRILDLDRWLSRPVDSLRLATLLANRDRFPVEYRHVITASALPLRARIDSLRAMAGRHPQFFDLQYHLGDELLHRGPLLGLPRHQAIVSLLAARRLRPDFAGVAEHLAWAFTTEGQGDSARAWLDVLKERHPPSDEAATAEVRVFLEIAWQWRFAQPDVAAAHTARLLADSDILGSPELAGGPRSLPALGVPEGAIGFGRMIMERRSDLAQAGLMAQWLGAIGLGRYVEAAESAQQLRELGEEPRLAVLQVTALREVTGELPPDEPSPREALRRVADRRDLSEWARQRARQSLALLEADAPAVSGEGRFGRLLQARQLAAVGNHAEAVRLTDTLVQEDLHRDAPTLAAALRLFRAEWLGAEGRHAEAAAELLWQEHSDFPSRPREGIEAAEVDWAFSTMAMWRRASHLEADGELRPELCRMYAEVVRRWTGGDPVPAARADSARARAAVLRCGVAR